MAATVISIVALRRQYPSPSISHPARPPGTYCVGGSVCLSLNPRARPFPSDLELARALRIVNPTLPKVMARRLAEAIIDNNDGGDFEAAYRALRRALRPQLSKAS